MVIYTSYSNEIIPHTHLRAVAKEKKNGGEPFHVCFFGDQKDFYGVTLNGCRLEKGLIWSTESIARQLHHSIKEYIVRLLLCWLYRNLDVDFVYALDSVK